MKCIYCNSAHNLTSSDIISYAITGAKLSRNFVCHTHNSFTNENFEKTFIDNLKFIRNSIGLTTRDGKPIKFTGDILIDGEEYNDICLSDRKALYAPKGGVVSGKDKDGNTVLFGKSEKFTNIPGKGFKPIDPSKTIIRTSVGFDAFFDENALHSVAKISYEWFCYMNNIDSYNEEIFKEIVDYILLKSNDTTAVRAVTDTVLYTMLDNCSRSGSNSLFAYDDADGYTYVVFCLWNTVAYKTRICKSEKTDVSNTQTLNLEMYHLDGTKTDSTPIMFSLLNNQLSVASIEVTQIKSEVWKYYEQRLSKLLKTLDLSLPYLQKFAAAFGKLLTKYEKGIISLEELLFYEEPFKVVSIKCLEILAEKSEMYDEQKTSENNVHDLLNLENEGVVHMTEDDLKNYLFKLKDLSDKDRLLDYCKSILEKFNEQYI